MKSYRIVLPFVLTCILTLTIVCPAKDADPKPTFTPGQETRIDLPGIGGDHFILYVPQNYDPQRSWPVIFCHHGAGGKPTTSPFKQNTAGRDFIIVGMEYPPQVEGVMSTAQWHERGRIDAANCKTVFAYLQKYLNLDPTQRLVGGVSMGGFHSVTIIEESPDFFCAAVVIAAGRELRPPSDPAMTNPNALKAKPIYIGVGEKDVNNTLSRDLVAFYKKAGAVITFEEYPGLGHAPKPDSQILYKFLLNHGPLRRYDVAVAQADALKKNHQIGKALVAYEQAAAMLPDHPRTQSARDAAKAVLDEAETRFAAVQQAIDAKLFSAALKSLSELRRTYSGSSVADRATQWIDKFSNDPAMRDQIAAAKLNEKAEDLETRAKKAEDEGDLAAALKIYETYVSQCAGAEHYEDVKAHHEKLKADPRVAAKSDNQDAGAECKEWLAMARNLLAAGRKHLAKPYLQKVIDKYPDTDYAAEAKKMLEEIQ
ncbi:MAG: alpha/beta hydrolase-fold protein [Phycisphaeraceae bacterium]